VSGVVREEIPKYVLIEKLIIHATHGSLRQEILEANPTIQDLENKPARQYRGRYTHKFPYIKVS
jgi:hypothetical protein